MFRHQQVDSSEQPGTIYINVSVSEKCKEALNVVIWSIIVAHNHWT